MAGNGTAGTNGDGSALSVAVLGCGPLGIQVANRLSLLDPVRSVLVIIAPYQRKRPSLLAKVQRTWRFDGPSGCLQAITRRLFGPNAAPGRIRSDAQPLAGVRHLRVADLHDRESLEALRDAAPDLGVIAGTYILDKSVFSIPRLGCINLHSGKVPEYRGAAPGFWELYHGETEIGVTIHEVVGEVDAGRVLLQETFPFDPAPDQDPLSYIARFRDEVLRPNGIRMLAEAVEGIATGTVRPRPQDPRRARTFPMPDYRAKRELRERVARRRGN